MPRDPRDISLSAPERQTRRLMENEEAAQGGSRVFGQATAGAEGKEGKAGATWYSGTTVPSTGLGAVGDFYLRTTTSDVYKKTGEAAWSLEVNIKGTTGTAGTNGTNGATWYSGTTAPAGELGVNSDFYFRTTTDDVYKKEAGTWSIIANLKGSTGETGASGKEGPAGSAANNDWKNSVRAATTANITISTALNPADVLDGVTLAENDRVLVKNQTTKSENGIWIVKAVPVRAEDADAAAELSGGSTIYVEEGTRNKRRTFQVITPGNITPGTTAHEYLQLGFKDFGIVEALPTTEAVKNDKCTFKAAASVYWDLIYTEEGTYPWAKIGGPPMRAGPLSAEEKNNTEISGTGAPEMLAPLNMEFGGTFGAKWMQLRSTISSSMLLRLAINAVSKLETAAVGNAQFETFPSLATISPLTVVKGQKINIGYSIANGASLASFVGMTLEVDPIRVG